MARRLVTWTGLFLSLVVAVGTWLYVQGDAPPFPLNAWAFRGMVLLTTLFALLFGRSRRSL